MPEETFTSGGTKYRLFTYPSPADGKRYPAILLIHGNAGLTPPFGDQIRGFAEDLSKLGYFTAVPQYYADDKPHLEDSVPHVQTVSNAINEIAGRPSVDSKRIGLIGFSLGAATCMTYLAQSPAVKVTAFADFFGFLTPTITAGLSSFPPTMIFHNEPDGVVDVKNSTELNRLLPPTIDHVYVPYKASWPEMKHHPFKPGGSADKDSRDKATAWFRKYLSPTGI